MFTRMIIIMPYLGDKIRLGINSRLVSFDTMAVNLATTHIEGFTVIICSNVAKYIIFTLKQLAP